MRLVKTISFAATIAGIYTAIIIGDATNGLLLMILGELIDLPKVQ